MLQQSREEKKSLIVAPWWRHSRCNRPDDSDSECQHTETNVLCKNGNTEIKVITKAFSKQIKQKSI